MCRFLNSDLYKDTLKLVSEPTSAGEDVKILGLKYVWSSIDRRQSKEWPSPKLRRVEEEDERQVSLATRLTQDTAQLLSMVNCMELLESGDEKMDKQSKKPQIHRSAGRLLVVEDDLDSGVSINTQHSQEADQIINIIDNKTLYETKDEIENYDENFQVDSGLDDRQCLVNSLVEDLVDAIVDEALSMNG